MPQEGHLNPVFHRFGYLKSKPKKTLAFDWTHPDINELQFVKCDWHDFYWGLQELIPGDMPYPKGNVVSTHCFIHADHAGNRVTTRLQTGILFFVNRSPIVWYSNNQNMVETSTFSNEFVAMKIAVKLSDALRYKLWMFGIPIEGPTNVFCNTEAVTKNAIHPEATLKKEHHAIAYHQTREVVAAGMIHVRQHQFGWYLMKPLSQAALEFLCDGFMY
jgi:hypothetical protein